MGWIGVGCLSRLLVDFGGGAGDVLFLLRTIVGNRGGGGGGRVDEFGDEGAEAVVFGVSSCVVVAVPTTASSFS